MDSMVLEWFSCGCTLRKWYKQTSHDHSVGRRVTDRAGPIFDRSKLRSMQLNGVVNRVEGRGSLDTGHVGAMAELGLNIPSIDATLRDQWHPLPFLFRRAHQIN